MELAFFIIVITLSLLFAIAIGKTLYELYTEIQGLNKYADRMIPPLAKGRWRMKMDDPFTNNTVEVVDVRLSESGEWWVKYHYTPMGYVGTSRWKNFKELYEKVED